ncbi:hypothetical protein D3C71_1340390 [compost metagenome]
MGVFDIVDLHIHIVIEQGICRYTFGVKGIEHPLLVYTKGFHKRFFDRFHIPAILFCRS